MSSGSQAQLWIQFATCKRNAIYINRYHAKVERVDRWISMVSAIASSSAIAGWALWKELSFVWAVVIAVSQVLAAVKPFLPYKSLLKALSQLGPELEGLALAAEEEWFAVSHGMLTEQEIHKITMSSKEKCQQATHRAFKGMSLPEDGAIETTAERDAAAYMTTIMGNDDES